MCFLFPLALVLSLSSHQNATIFLSKRGIRWKDDHLSEKGWCFHSNNDVSTQIMKLSPKKVDNLRAREWEGEKKRIRNSAPKIQNVIQPIVTCHVSFARSINISSFALLQQCKIRTNQDTLIHLCAKILKKKLKIYYVWMIRMSRICIWLKIKTRVNLRELFLLSFKYCKLLIIIELLYFFRLHIYVLLL